MKRYDLVIFDCDGVLVDSEVLVAEAHVHALNALGYPVSLADLLRRFVGVPDRDMYATIEAEWGRSLPSDYDDAIKAAVTSACRHHLRAIQGVTDALDAISSPICVASSSTAVMLEMKLRQTGLYDRFAPNIFSVSEVTRGKPAPDLFLLAASRLGVPPSDCLVIEDSVAGVQAANAAGMTAFGFAGASHCGPNHRQSLGREGVCVVFDDMRELASLIARNGASG